MAALRLFVHHDHGNALGRVLLVGEDVTARLRELGQEALARGHQTTVALAVGLGRNQAISPCAESDPPAPGW